MVFIVVTARILTLVETKMIALGVIFCFITVCAAQIPLLPGKDDFVLNFASPVYVCSDEKSASWIDTSTMEVQRHNETSAFMGGHISILQTFEPQTLVEVLIKRDVFGQYELIASHEICDICSELDDPDSVNYKYMKSTDLPKSCPVPAGEYNMNNMTIDTNDLELNDGTVGAYQATVNFYKLKTEDCRSERVFIACVKLDVVIERK